jgi:broad specificity phosphatase PhoE
MLLESICRSKLCHLIVPISYCHSSNTPRQNQHQSTSIKVKVLHSKHPVHPHSLLPGEKIVHFVRHAEGHHNVAGRLDPAFGYLQESLEDAKLTDEGIKQCEALSEIAEEKVKNVELIIVSPLNRTIQTAKFTFPYLIGKIPVIAVENIRETTGLHPCDRRLSIKEHKQQYDFVNFDEIVHNEDHLYNQYIFREPQPHVVERGRMFVEWLKNRPEKEVIIVSHGSFLHTFFTKVIVPENPNEKTYFNNCEMRSFVVSFDVDNASESA